MKQIELSITDWAELVKTGAQIPVTTVLNGISMEPTIRGGRDPVTVVPLAAPLQRGDIVLFQRKDGAYVIHRVYSIKEDGWVQTWGDNCRHPDEPISESTVLGMVQCVNKKGKQILLNTQEQREKGIRWLNSPIRRRVWFISRFWRHQAGRIKRKIKGQ